MSGHCSCTREENVTYEDECLNILDTLVVYLRLRYERLRYES